MDMFITGLILCLILNWCYHIMRNGVRYLEIITSASYFELIFSPLSLCMMSLNTLRGEVTILLRIIRILNGTKNRDHHSCIAADGGVSF